MKTNKGWQLAGLVLGLTALGGAAALGFVASNKVLPVKKGTAITIEAQLTLESPLKEAWIELCSAEGFSTITGCEFSPGDLSKSFRKIGDSIPARISGDRGNVVVTAYTQDKELRVAFEPEAGNYLCAKRFVLASAANGSQLSYWNRYTDDQPNADKTAATAQQEMTECVEKFASAFTP